MTSAASPSTSTLHELRTLMASRHPLIVAESVEEERVRGFVVQAAARLEVPVFEWTVTQGLRPADDRGSWHGITADPAKMLAHVAGLTLRAVFLMHDLHPHLASPTVARLLRDLLPTLARTGSTIVLSGSDIELPAAIRADAIRLRIALPDRGELSVMLDGLVEATGREPAADVRARTLDALTGLTLNQARQAVASVLLDGTVDADDVATLMERKVRTIADGGLLEYFPAEDNHARLAGMANLKAWLERAAVAASPEARALNISPPRGILLAGVPGCGKSLAAKYIALRWRRPLLKLDAGMLYDKYIGESEKNLRGALNLAESLEPIVLWIDEIEKGLAVGGDDAGAAVGRRMLGTLLTWMQERRADVFVVATSNDLSILPPELQRKGRFDEVFFVDLPTPQERAAIFAAQLAIRRQPRERFDLAALVAASEGFSGAEIEQSVVAGLLRALQVGGTPTTDAIVQEVSATVPLSRSRPDAIAAVRARARDFVPAG